MDAYPASQLRILIAEPAVLLVSILTDAVKDVGQVSVYAGDLSDLEVAAAAANAEILIVGPTFRVSGLAVVVPRLVSRGTRVVIVSSGPLDGEGSTLLLAGASGFLPDLDTSPGELAEAVRRVAGGTSALHPDVVHAVLVEWRRQRQALDPATGALTSRELDVLRGLRDGLTTRLLAARLGVADKTIEAHKSRLFAKLGARNQSQAVQLAATHGLI